MKDERQESETVVVIDDDEAARVSIGQMLKLRGYKIEVFSSAESALAWTGIRSAGCIISDVKMPGMDGESFLKEMTGAVTGPPVIMITGHGDISMAVRTLKSGAYDFVEKPFEEDILLASVQRAVEKSRLRWESEDLRRQINILTPGEEGRYGMVGKSKPMQLVYEQIEFVARSHAPVLICGETGVGKELVARAIHNKSSRAQGPFVPVNAGALPETMLESELFGHAKGAFTGADCERDGKLVTSSGGTLLLDEVETLSERAQVQLLRVLEDGLVQPLGKDEPRKADIRLLTTTKVDLKELISQGRIREDFYHRIVVLSITVPPLRERREDIPLLISNFLKLAAVQNSVSVPEIPEKRLAEMMNMRWPGNVRELRNAVERMVITSNNNVAGPLSIEESDAASRLLSIPSAPGRLQDELERTEKAAIEAALREFNGGVSETSRTLGISRRALYERMKKYGLRKEDFRE